jgi:hypothetical protein
MSQLSALDQAKLDALTGLIAAARGGGASVQVAELVAVDWPQPDGRVYYASTFADDVWPELRGLLGGAPVEPRLEGGQFLDVTRDSGISDDSVSLNLWDADHAISDLFETHGEGVRVEIFFYFPQVDLLLSQWFGHLRPPEDADEERFTARAENGFLSVMLPLPRRSLYDTCQAVYGVLLKTQEEIDEHDCPVNIHIGGTIGRLDPATGQPYPTCPRNSRAECTKRIGDSLSFLAGDTKRVTYPVGSRGAFATTYGNENKQKRPLRVIAGERTVRDLDLLAHVVEVGRADHPERGAIKLKYAVSEGELDYLGDVRVNNTLIKPEHWNVRLGAPRQPGSGFSPEETNYSGTATLQVVLQGDFRNVDPAGISTEIRARGKKDVRVYSSETEFALAYTTSRAWWLLEALRNKRWGMGAAVPRFPIESDFIPLDEWFKDYLSFTDKRTGAVYTGYRSDFRAELIDRTAQQQVNDICLAGRCTVPFPYQGTLRVFPLKGLTAEELAAAPVFSDYGTERNIIRDETTGKSSLTRTSLSDADLPNSIVGTFDDRERDYQEHTLPPFESIDAQLRAGRAFGDTGRRVVEKPYKLLGVTEKAEASRLSVQLRDLGEFDEGGIENNERVRFQTFFTQAITLYKSKVIRVLSKSLVNRRTGVQRFEYFRVRSVRQLPNLLVEVSAQAYPVEYYAQMEQIVEVPAPDLDADIDPYTLMRWKRPPSAEILGVQTTHDTITLEWQRTL